MFHERMLGVARVRMPGVLFLLVGTAQYGQQAEICESRRDGANVARPSPRAGGGKGAKQPVLQA